MSDVHKLSPAQMRVVERMRAGEKVRVELNKFGVVRGAKGGANSTFAALLRAGVIEAGQFISGADVFACRWYEPTLTEAWR